MRFALVFMVVLAGCKKDKEAVESETGPTYYGDAVHVFADRCMSCHQAGGIGPFALDDYETAKLWAPVIETAVTNRTMPPWLVTDDGTCGEFMHSRALSDEEIATIVDWVQGGTPAGNPEDGVTELPEVARLDRVDATLETPKFTPIIQGGQLAEFDEYRCFEIGTPSDKQAWITGYDVHPGNDAVVHHVIGYTVPNTASNRTAIDNHEAASSRDGWPCFEDAGSGISERDWPISWAPGQGAMTYPDGFGIPIGPDDVLVVQVHYNLVDPINRGESDQTTIELRIDDDVEQRGFSVFEDKFLEGLYYGESIPAGESAYQYTWKLSAWEIAGWGGVAPPIDVMGVMPHMHERGRKMWMRKDDDDTCLVEVKNWDFNWQLGYWYDKPIRLEAGEAIEITCEWDTSDDTSPVKPGWGTGNEMCLAALWAAEAQ